MKKVFVRLLCVLFAIVFSCVNATAAEVVVEIQEELIESFSFPLSINASYSGDVLNAEISLREEFEEVEEYELNVRHWLLGGSILYETVTNGESIVVEDVEPECQYGLTLTLYYPDRIKYIDGSFVAKNTDDGIVFEYEHEKIDDIINFYSYLEENREMTDEEYEEVFEHLDIPSFIEEEVAKEHKHLVRLEEFKDSLTTVGFYNSDGTSTVYTFANPVRYVDTDGTIKDYSAEIVSAVESVEQKGYKYSNRFGKMSVNFSDELSNSKGTEIVSEHGRIEFGIYGAEQSSKGSILDKIFPSKSGKASLTKDGTAQKVKYEKIGTSGYTIKSEPVINGAKTSVVMSEVPEDNKVRVWVSTEGLLPIVDNSGSFVNFIDTETKRIVYRFGYVELSDSGDNDNRRSSINNRVSIIGQNKSKVLIEITCDYEFVYSPVSSYPIEATVYLTSPESYYAEYQAGNAESDSELRSEIGSVSSGAVMAATSDVSTYATSSAPPATEDGYYVTCYYTESTSNIYDISAYANGNTTSWDSAYLYMGKAGTYWNGTACVHNAVAIIMQYETLSISTMGIPAGRINTAGVVLYGISNSTSATSFSVKIERINSSWQESGVGGYIYHQVDESYSGNEYEEKAYRYNGDSYLTVTDFVKDHLRNANNSSAGIPNYGFRISTSSSSDHLLTFGSKDHPDASKRPKLSITYEEYVFTPYENTIRIKSKEPYVKLDYGETYEAISDNIILLKKSGDKETENIALEYRSLDTDIATVDKETGVVTAEQTEGYAIIEVKRTDTSDCTYITIDVSLHIEITEDDTDYSEVGDATDITSYKIKLGGKTWICYDYNVPNPSAEAKVFVAQYMFQLNCEQYFTPQELKYLYMLDPQGVSAYVKKRAWEIDSGTEKINILNRVKYKNELFYEMYGKSPKWYYADTLEIYTGPTPTASNIGNYCSEAELMFGRHSDPEDVKRFQYFLLDGVLTAVCFYTAPYTIVHGIFVFGTAAANTYMSYDVIKETIESGEGVKLGDALWLVTSLIGVVVSGSQLVSSIKAALTKLDDGASISVLIGSQTVDVKNVDSNGLTGKWVDVNESMSDFSRAYQKQITGREGQAWLQHGVKFDGVIDGCLVDAKGKYAQFIDPITGEFKDWFTGYNSLYEQALRQIAASDGAPIRWYFAEETSMNLIESFIKSKQITNIEFIFVPAI